MFYYFITPPLDLCHHTEHQSQGWASIFQSADGSALGHMEPDPGPLGLHPAEEGCTEENLHVVTKQLGVKVL